MFSRKSKQENKAKLEHKLYLARETPEPIFDVSECDLREVPHGIYSLCRVFLKEHLKLDTNNLKSLSGGGNLGDLYLLKVLNISQNCFTKLPDEISFLTNLQELYASHNSLSSIPDTMCNLKNLRILDLSHNNIKILPNDIGTMVSLNRFDISHNHIKQLPISICKMRLTHLSLDSANFEYPPEEVVERGLEAIMQYICDDNGIDYEKMEKLSELMVKVEESNSVMSYEDEDNKTKAKIWELENIKRDRTMKFLEIEKHNELLQKQELEIAEAQKLNREKLLKDIAHEQDEFDSRLLQMQNEKEKDKFRLIEQLHEAEQNAYVAIEYLLALNKEPAIILLENEKKEEEKLISSANSHEGNYKKVEIVEAMRNILQHETEHFRQLNQQRIEESKSILQKELQWGQKLSELSNIHNMNKKEVASKILSDMELQKAALGTLLERNDARSWGLLQQVNLVESQLAALTQIELGRRKLELDEQINNFAEKRIELSILLMNLLEQQDIRRCQILETLRMLENNWDKQSQDFWLKQYQALMCRTPEGILETQKIIDPILGEALLMNGVIHCLPHLAKIMQNDYELETVDEKTLIESGIGSKQDRLKILDAFNFYKRQKHQIDKKNKIELIDENSEQGPSAPPLEHLKYVGGSLTECVVCMDKECQVIFVPCGHIVCCVVCSTELIECPFCRAEIERKIKIQL